MALTVRHGELSDTQHSIELRKAVIAATIEWYYVFIYGTAAGPADARAVGYGDADAIRLFSQIERQVHIDRASSA